MFLANTCQPSQWNHANQVSSSNFNQSCDKNQSQLQMRPPSPKTARLPVTLSQRPTVITEQKPVPPVVCNSTHISKDGSTQNAQLQGPDYSQTNTHENNMTEQLRQLRGKFCDCFTICLLILIWMVFIRVSS